MYVKGAEVRPALSGEQFRLLSYLYQRAGKVVAREELVLQVWPDAHAEGVSEEALDALVRRVRERLAQAGGERSYIVTLRGQGFRLDASTTTAVGVSDHDGRRDDRDTKERPLWPLCDAW